MWFEDKLTEEDVRRASGIPITPRAAAAGHVALLEACDILADLEHVAGFTIIDNALRSQGEPQRYWWHKGPWPGDAGGGG